MKPARDFTFYKRQVWQSLKKQHGEALVMDKPRQEVYAKLTAYFSGCEKEANEMGLDMNKGIMLVGPVGCGKSSIMEGFKRNPMADYRMINCLKIRQLYEANGPGTLLPYGVHSFHKHSTNPIHYCFDDVGVEGEANWYGQKRYIMAEIILNRYDEWQKPHIKMVTHITTNLIVNEKVNEFEELYGDRVADRIKHMFNLIPFGDAKSLRR